MPILTGGNIIVGGTVMPGSKTRVTWCATTPTDALVGGGYRTPADNELAADVTNGNVYERDNVTHTWTRRDVT